MALLCIVMHLSGYKALLRISTHHRGPPERLQSPQSQRHLGRVCACRAVEGKHLKFLTDKHALTLFDAF